MTLLQFKSEENQMNINFELWIVDELEWSD